MESTRAVCTVALDLSRELLGPAEGQYVVFQGVLDASPGPGPKCFDAYDFDLVQPDYEVCLELALDAPLESGAIYLQFIGRDGDQCLWISEGQGILNIGESSVSYCVPTGVIPLPPGSYSVMVSSSPMVVAIPYTVRIETTAPVANAAPDENQYCVWPECAIN